MTVPRSTATDAFSSASAGYEALRDARFGFLVVLAVPLAAGFGYSVQSDIAGFDLTGWLWLGLLAIGGTVLLAERTANGENRIAMPWKPWSVWLAATWLSLGWCEHMGFRNVQTAMQFSSPLLIGVLASLFVRTERQLAILMRTFSWTLPVLLLCAAASSADPEAGMHVKTRSLALTAVLIGCTFIAGWPPLRLVSLAGWVACMLLDFLTGSRMATAALLAIPVAHPSYRTAWWRIAAIAAALAMGTAVFYSPQFQQRFFVGGEGGLEQLARGEFLTFGRLEAWPLIWEEAAKRPLLGAGVGAAADFVPTVWPEMTHPHNDYLRLYFDTGCLGLGLFLAAACWQLAALARRARASTGIRRTVFAAAFLGLVGLLVTSLTDNTLIYNNGYTNPLFALIGAAYGAAEDCASNHQDRRFLVKLRKTTPWRRGQLVEVRSLDEILATLDADQKCEGMPFMPEMARFCGQQARIFRRADKTCVEGHHLRRLQDTVFLEGLRCDGSAHDGCQRTCLIFWKTAWLKPAAAGPSKPRSGDAGGTAARNLNLATMKNGRYYCQSTELAAATSHISRWDPTAYFADLFTGEATIARLAYVVLRMIGDKLRHVLGGKLGGPHARSPVVALGLEPGQLVEIKPRTEINTTLNPDGRNRGLTFEPEMLDHCGRRYRVAFRVQKIISEETGKMLHLQNTVALDAVTCQGTCAKNCPRSNYLYWREIWLRPVAAHSAPLTSNRRLLLKTPGLRALGTLAVGLNGLLGSRAGPATGILTYHRVAPGYDGVPRSFDSVAPSRFREQLEGLMRRGFTFWPLSRILEHHERGEPIPPRTLAVTFDDGFQAVYTHAWPVLRELGVPATVFLATAYLDSENPFPFDPWGITWRNALPPDAYRPLTTEQCRELKESGLVELGAHTHSHEDFRGRPDAIAGDLQTCLRIFGERFGLSERVPFAFPFGKPHEGYASEPCVAAVRAAGVRCALTTRSALVAPGSDPFSWGRFNVFPWDSSGTLAAKVSGWYSWADVLRERLLRIGRGSRKPSAPAALREGTP